MNNSRSTQLSELDLELHRIIQANALYGNDNIEKLSMYTEFFTSRIWSLLDYTEEQLDFYDIKSAELEDMCHHLQGAVEWKSIQDLRSWNDHLSYYLLSNFLDAVWRIEKQFNNRELRDKYIKEINSWFTAYIPAMLHSKRALDPTFRKHLDELYKDISWQSWNLQHTDQMFQSLKKIWAQ